MTAAAPLPTPSVIVNRSGVVHATVRRPDGRLVLACIQAVVGDQARVTALPPSCRACKAGSR